MDNEYVNYAKERNIPVYMSAALLCHILSEKLLGVTTIGITGTRGKSTTTHIIYHMLKEAGKRVHLCGNVRGLANLPLLKEIEEGDYVVMELDSWQLQGFHEMKISPHVAVFTSFLDDHLNYYKGDREAYFNDKAAIFQYQKSGDTLIASPQAEEEFSKRSLGGQAVVPEILHLDSNLIGEHNQVSLALAHEVGNILLIDQDTIREALKTFTPVEGRLQSMGEIKGVQIYNDNNATTPDATIAAIKAVKEAHKKNPILIVGGSDKGLDLSVLEKEIQENIKATIYLKGTGTEKISLEKPYSYETLEECIKNAFGLAEQGDVILFSPGFASFSSYFRNEYDRGDAFIKEVEKYR